MTETANTAEAATDIARTLFEKTMAARISAVREVAEAADDATVREREAADAIERHQKAWDSALRAGWTEKELRLTGVRQPGGAAPKRRTRKSASEARPSEPESSESRTSYDAPPSVSEAADPDGHVDGGVGYDNA